MFVKILEHGLNFKQISTGILALKKLQEIAKQKVFYILLISKSYILFLSILML